MTIKEHSVKESHFTLAEFPGVVFRIQADTVEQAKRILHGVSCRTNAK
jgi:glyceraldehyde-3-phosphate dehydrogenase/erythrose-4-phosphate dehydrogenase